MLQAVIGFALFLATGYCVSLALFKKADRVERAAYSLFLALTVPVAILAFLNVFLGVPFTTLTVYVVLGLLAVACFAWSKRKRP